MRSKGGRNGENSGMNKGSLSLYLATFRVARLGGGGCGGIIRARTTLFLVTGDGHVETKRVSRRRELQSQISQSVLHCRTVLASCCGSSARSNIRSKSGRCLFRTSSTRRHAWLAHPVMTLVIAQRHECFRAEPRVPRPSWADPPFFAPTCASLLRHPTLASCQCA